MHTGVLHRGALFGIVELPKVVGQHSVISAFPGIPIEVLVLLALPPEAIDVIDLMLSEYMLQECQEGKRNILIEE
jgi:hypothetical protein